ncbi:CRISPR-associated endonuclease Cas2 [Pyrodictium abyssi]|uniref:CRISPR-associated endonuclease Cas2 n=1 Tax=Pyrodictium abyssi TaxID=54256 RepID=UPI0030C6EF49
METVIILVAYDISDPGRRDRAAKLLQSMGLSRLQRSLYAGRGGAAKARDIARALERILDSETDVADILVLPDHAWSRRIEVGNGRARVPGRARPPGVHIA